MFRLFGFGTQFRTNRWLGYAVAVAAFVVATALRSVLNQTLPPGFPFLTFFPAVIFTAFIAGTGPAIACAVLSGLAAWILFIPAGQSLAVDGPTALALGFYTFTVSVNIALFHFMTIAVDRLRREREVTATLYERQRTMFQELQHRVANNMSFVASLLHLQKGKVAADPSTAAAAIDEATLRIGLMSRVHRRLYDPASSDLPAGDYFRDLCVDLLQATGVTNIDCTVDMPPIKLDIDQLMALSLLVTEIVTNSLKHAFVEQARGTIRLSMEQVAPDRLALTISDDGCGLPAGYDAKASRGLGTRIVQGLVAQLRGDLDIDGNCGMTTRLTFPA